MEENGSGAHETAAHVGLLTTGKGEDGEHAAASTTPPSKLSFCMSKNGVGGKETTKETTKVEARTKQSWVRVSLFMEPLGGGVGGAILGDLSTVDYWELEAIFSMVGSTAAHL